jgi:drug/metabolite transporter (DMT)-like permease
MTLTAIGILLVILAAVIEGFGSVCLKKSQTHMQRQLFWVVMGVLFYAVHAIFYTAALRFLPLSAAFALASLTFVFVALLSKWLLHEQITQTKWIGIALIVAGTGLIGAYA